MTNKEIVAFVLFLLGIIFFMCNVHALLALLGLILSACSVTILFREMREREKKLSSKRNVIVFSGLPLSGKGTLSSKLSQELGLPVFCPGRIYRTLREEDSELGHLVKDSLKDGGFCPSDLTNRIFTEELKKNEDAKFVILDGYPRNQVQLDYLRKYTKLNFWFHLSAEENTLQERASNRLECSACAESVSKTSTCSCGKTYGDANWKVRFDDTPEMFQKRCAVYKEQTQPMLDLASEYITNIDTSTEDITATYQKLLQILIGSSW